MSSQLADRAAAELVWRRRQFVIDQLERFGLLIAWAALIVVFGIVRPEAFLSWANFATILGSQAVLVVATLGLIIPLTAGDFDLSVASVLTLASMMLAVLNVNLGIPIELAILAALGMGLVTGLVNGFFIIVFRIHSLIVTLGVGTFLHGITLWISDSMTISGIDFQTITPRLAARLNAPNATGVVITRTSRQIRTGFEPGDIIISFNGTEVKDDLQLIRLMGDARIGSNATVVILRDGRKMELRIPIEQQRR